MTQENELCLLLRLVEEIMYQVTGLDIVLFVSLFFNRAFESYSET